MGKYFKDNFALLCFKAQVVIGFGLLYAWMMIEFFNTFHWLPFVLLTIASSFIVVKLTLRRVNTWADKTTDQITSRQYEDILEVISDSEDEVFLKKVKEIIVEKKV